MDDLQEFLNICAIEEANYMACALFISSKYGRAGTHEMSGNLWGEVQRMIGYQNGMKVPEDIKLQSAYNEGYRAASKKAIGIITKGL
jgi:hypothetical protein